ncbi:FAD-dependent oxidoreductase [Virgibacillus halophilus]|uniref:FAD-dependent oxidoreductase n=1 Tax=Tigheibacillus halophilus TaxID=361280 RepID=A0ABU5C1S1_9BACI|nr:FAD-dependent oxidoreductase [Virgibacillus halophilus]
MHWKPGGVEFVTGASLRECGPDYIVYEKDGRPIHVPTLTTIWAAGVRANAIVEAAGFQTTRGKIEVTPELRAPGYEDIFVVGDCASIINPKTNRPFPPTAQMAIQQAKIISTNILKRIGGEGSLSAFVPKDLGTVASLGHNDAIAVLFKNWKMFGWKATFMKKMIDNRYLLKLGGLNLLFKKREIQYILLILEKVAFNLFSFYDKCRYKLVKGNRKFDTVGSFHIIVFCHFLRYCFYTEYAVAPDLADGFSLSDHHYHDYRRHANYSLF